MEYPPNPTHPFRVETLAPALVAVMVIAILQPLVVIITTMQPMLPGEATWRVQVLALLLGAAPQISVGIAFIAMVGLFGERYRPVRGAAIGAIVLGVVLIPVIIFYGLDTIEIRRMVPYERLRSFQLNAIQAAGVGVILVPVLLWLGWRGLRAGKKPQPMDITDALLIDKQPLPGPLDPRVTN